MRTKEQLEALIASEDANIKRAKETGNVRAHNRAMDKRNRLAVEYDKHYGVVDINELFKGQSQEVIDRFKINIAALIASIDPVYGIITDINSDLKKLDEQYSFTLMTPLFKMYEEIKDKMLAIYGTVDNKSRDEIQAIADEVGLMANTQIKMKVSKLNLN